MKWIVCTITFVLGGLGFFGLDFLKNKTTLPVKGHLTVNLLEDAVEVYRDRNGVPHIEAKNSGDLYKAFGYIYASDKLPLLVHWRERYLGEQSKRRGRQFLAKDRLSRSFGLRRQAEKAWHRLKSNKNKGLATSLENFVAGINAFIDSDKLPLELRLDKKSLQPFTAIDVIGVVAEFSLAGALDDFLETSKIDKFALTLPKAWRPFVGSWEPVNQEVLKWNLNSLREKALPQRAFAILVGKERVANNKPLMIFHSWHRPSAPGFFYEAHLKSPDADIYGFFAPLLPFPVAAQTAKHGWAFTPTHVNEIALRPLKNSNYQQRWQSFDLPNGETYPGRWQVKWRANKPIIPLFDKNSGLKSWWELSWQALEKPEMYIKRLYEVGKASSWQQVQRSLKKGLNIGRHFLFMDDQNLKKLSFIQQKPGKFALKVHKDPMDSVLVSLASEAEVGPGLAGNYSTSLRREDLIDAFKGGEKLTARSAEKLGLFKERPPLKKLGRKMLLFLRKQTLFEKEKYKQIFSWLDEWQGQVDHFQGPSQFFSQWAVNFSKLSSDVLFTNQVHSLPKHFTQQLLLSRALQSMIVHGDPLRDKIRWLVTESFKNTANELKEGTLLSFKGRKLLKWDYLSKLNYWANTFLQNRRFPWPKMPFEQGAGADRLVTSLRFIWQPGDQAMGKSLIPAGNSAAWPNAHFFDQLPIFLSDGWKKINFTGQSYADAKFLQLLPAIPSY